MRPRATDASDPAGSATHGADVPSVRVVVLCDGAASLKGCRVASKRSVDRRLDGCKELGAAALGDLQVVPPVARRFCELPQALEGIVA